jgi:hypothetical protein
MLCLPSRGKRVDWCLWIMSGIYQDCSEWQRRQLVPSSLLWTSVWHERQSDDCFLNFSPTWQDVQRTRACCPARTNPVCSCLKVASPRIDQESGEWHALHSKRIAPCGEFWAEAHTVRLRVSARPAKRIRCSPRCRRCLLRSDLFMMLPCTSVMFIRGL